MLHTPHIRVWDMWCFSGKKGICGVSDILGFRGYERLCKKKVVCLQFRLQNLTKGEPVSIMEIQPYTLLDLTYPERNRKLYFHIITLVVISARLKLRSRDSYKNPGSL